MITEPVDVARVAGQVRTLVAALKLRLGDEPERMDATDWAIVWATLTRATALSASIVHAKDAIEAQERERVA